MDRAKPSQGEAGVAVVRWSTSVIGQFHYRYCYFFLSQLSQFVAKGRIKTSALFLQTKTNIRLKKKKYIFLINHNYNFGRVRGTMSNKGVKPRST